MGDIKKELEKLKNPENIYRATYASDACTLMKFFKKDPTVKRIIDTGAKVVPLIAEELSKDYEHLDSITLSCYAYILQKVDPESAVKVLTPLFPKAVENPDPFFLYFAAQAIRIGLKLPVDPVDPICSRGDLLETLEIVRRLCGSE